MATKSSDPPDQPHMTFIAIVPPKACCPQGGMGVSFMGDRNAVVVLRALRPRGVAPPRR